MKVVETDEKIDIELLKKKEKIYFFEDVILFEDELADNGCALLNAKMVLCFILYMTLWKANKIMLVHSIN